MTGWPIRARSVCYERADLACIGYFHSGDFTVSERRNAANTKSQSGAPALEVTWHADSANEAREDWVRDVRPAISIRGLSTAHGG